MEQSSWQRGLASLQTHLSQLEESLTLRLQRFAPFRTLLSELMRSADKFATSCAQLADSCDQEILTQLSESEQSLGQAWSGLRSSLLGVAEGWRIVAIRSKNEILEPLKVFTDNYRKVSAEGVGKVKLGLGLCQNAEQEVGKARDAYYAICEKLERHKEGQAKVMLRIENGEPGELERFNKTTRNLLERVSSSQRRYTECVQRANDQTSRTRSLIEKQVVALKHNEAARVEFLKKVAASQSKLLELGKQLNLGGSKETSAKFELKGRSDLRESLERVDSFSRSTTLQAFVSHEELVRSKRHREFEQENPMLMEMFNKVKENERSGLLLFAQGCLELEPACRLISLQRMRQEVRMVFPPEWETFREKIIALQHYALYFSHLLNRQLNELPSYYLKLTPPFFAHLATLIPQLLTRLDLNMEGALAELAMATAYKLLKLAERVVEKRKDRKVGGMKVLIEGLSSCKQLREEKVLLKLLRFLIRKGQKKRNEPKGVVGFTKGLFSTLTGRKEESQSSEEDQFNALVELTHLMANLSLPTDIVLPFLKQQLKHSETSYLYLKDILQGRRDREERQKLLIEEGYYARNQKELKETFAQGRQAAVSLRITAQRGFLTLSERSLRLCCRQLRSVHLEIVYRLPVPPSQQWNWICNPSPALRFTSSLTEILQPVRVLQVQDIIVLDVNRSLHIHAHELSPDNLKRFLIFYAREHPDLAYCQGMNYLAGYCLLKCKQEDRAYAAFSWVMERYFWPVFADSFSRMRGQLYVFDRLLAIFHPDLSDHFRREMIAPECFAVGWIITAFTSCYQYTQTSFLVDWFWARFVLWGWREFYRLAMWLLHLNREALLAAGYDGCLQILGEIAKSKVMMVGSREEFMETWRGELEGAYEGYSVSDELIGKLLKDFVHE